ncbi:hypothetical protein [uncultured Thioclava sp.]|uniref:hypothetical protein n=1 Tax=uncultured Thioclava sp. TaxID=473858 RepID=UPI0025F939AF|nr:hypothetical protein [uncultured Thioclava sp.]
MSRHVIDHAKPASESARLQRFLTLQRKEGVHPAVQDLSKRSHGESGARVTQFLRIERHEEV